MNFCAFISLCMLCIATTTVSARPVRIVNRKSRDFSEPKKPKTEVFAPRIHVPHASASVAAPTFPSNDDGIFHLLGLDPAAPLTQAEATFLDETIRNAFHKIHEEKSIDLAATNDVAIVHDDKDGLIDGGGNDNENEKQEQKQSHHFSLRGRRPDQDHSAANPTQAQGLDDKLVSAAPSAPPSIDWTDNNDIVLEEARIYLEHNSVLLDQIHKEVLEKLKESPFHRLKKIKKVLFWG